MRDLSDGGACGEFGAIRDQGDLRLRRCHHDRVRGHCHEDAHRVVTAQHLLQKERVQDDYRGEPEQELGLKLAT